MLTIESSGTHLFTVGMPDVELELHVPDLTWVSDGEQVLRTISSYVDRTGTTLRAGETFGYGYWLVQFEEGSDGRLALAEPRADHSGIVPGARFAMRYWRDQHTVCDRYQTAFDPPRPDHKVAVSNAVFLGEAVQGVRYPAPAHMSGWYLTTASYDGVVANLRVEHLYHLTAARPDLAKFLALPPGHRFDTTGGEWVLFDDVVAAAN